MYAVQTDLDVIELHRIFIFRRSITCVLLEVGCFLPVSCLGFEMSFEINSEPVKNNYCNCRFMKSANHFQYNMEQWEQMKH